MAEQEEDDERLEEEKKQALQMYEDMQTKVKQKMEFHQKNSNPHFFDEDELRKFDGSIKKNTAFAKKLRELTEAKREALRKDFETLNLTKYIEEVAKSIAESKLKLADVSCAVFISSLVHCRYDGFAALLTDGLQRVYASSKEDEDKGAASTKYRLGLRLIGELVLAGIIEQGLGISFISDILAKAIRSDQKSKTYSFVSVVTSFARQFADDFAGILPRKYKMLYTKYQLTPPQTNIIPPSQKAMFAGILTEYFDSVKKQLLNEHKDMHKRARRNRQILQNKGELSSERQEENEKAEKTYEKLLSNVTTLSEILDMEMPDLPEDRTPQDTVGGISIDIQLPSGASDAEFGATSLWEDEEQRSFYEDVTDIKPFIPAILYETGKRKKTDSSSSDPGTDSDPTTTSKDKNEDSTENDEQRILEEMIKETENLTIEDIEEPPPQPLEEPVELSAVEQSDVKGGGGTTPEPNQFDEFLIGLPNMMNRKIVDVCATEFCLNLNTKMNRQKLCRALFNVDRNRMDLIPFYARFICTISPILPDVADTLIDMLTRDFRFQIRKKDQIHVHTKIKNARFIAELTKFGVFSKIDAMKCITLTLQDFTHHNVELACTFIEHCGRYLLRTPESYLRAKALLEILIRKKNVQHLDGRQKALIDEALYCANPPETKAFVRVKRDPIHEYILLQLYKELNKLNTEKVLKQMRKLPWKDMQVFHWAVQAMTDAWNIKFSNVHCLANLLAGLRPYQEEVTVWVVDGVLEDIRLGLEINENRMNQRRVAMIKYLGELYNYQLIEADVIFRTLYTILTFGCNPDGSPGPLDPFDSYFRCRLVCVLLDTCGAYFDHGTAKKKLEAFLVFFQCYLFSKRRPLPLEVEQMITDCLLGVQPKLALYSTAQEAAEAASNLEKRFRSKVGVTDEEEDSDEEEDADPMNNGSRNEEEGEEDEEDEEDYGEDDDDEDDMEGEEEEDDYEEEDVSVLKSGPKLMKCKEDDDFLSSLDKLMSDSRKADPNVKAPQVDIAIPLHLKGGVKGPGQQPAKISSDPGELKFTLITKKGRKQELKEISIPTDSKLASGLSDTQQMLRAEQEEMKKLVLTHERRQEEEDYQAMMESVINARFQHASNIRADQSGRRRSSEQGGGQSNTKYQHSHAKGSRRPHPQQKRQQYDRQQY